jgi:5-methylcytosine-specific restriction endonuclease McrA
MGQTFGAYPSPGITSWPQWSLTPSEAMRQYVLQRDLYTCYMCFGPAGEVDHVTPPAQMAPWLDPHAATNLKAACRTCNARKGQRTPFQMALDSLACQSLPPYNPFR